MKNLIKNILPKKVQEFIIKKSKTPIFNYFNSDYNKKALLSYVTKPFKKNSQYIHTNFYEANIWAQILHKSGYSVDIIDYDYNVSKINLEKYDLICGFGEVFEKYIYTYNAKAKTVIYATGMHNCFQNDITFKRLKAVYNKKGVWLGDSVRYVNKCYSSHVSYVDAVVALGNEICVNSYKKYNKNVFGLDSLFYKFWDYQEIVKNKKENFHKHFLWFGSSGAIHKGLDLLLDYFSKRDDIFLHICGNLSSEKEFCKVYAKELFKMKNIIYHGFVGINTQKFKNIMTQCGFVIFPSCSEGGSPSVLTCIGNGGLIPIITKETTIDTGYEIWVEGFSQTEIDKAIKEALIKNKNEITELAYKNAQTVCNRYSLKNYEKNLTIILRKILNENDEM